MHHSTERFRKLLLKLPKSTQKIAERNFQLLRINPKHPSLHFKKTGKFWSIRIGSSYRALGIKDNNDFIWTWIGSHDQYEKMIKK